MSQQPPTGPGGEPGPQDAPRSPRTPDEAAGEPTESFGRSPYDVPETHPEDATAAYPVPSYDQAPDPGRTIYSEASTTEPDPGADGPDRRRRWVLPVVIAVVVLLVAGAVAAALLLGGDDDDPTEPATTAPTTEQTTDPEPTTEPEATEEPTEPATTEEPTEEPTPEPTEEPSELLADLEESVAVGDLTFELNEDGFTADEDVEGATEAWRGRYEAGDERIDMLATLWPDNDAADAFVAELVEGVDGEEVETGYTYTNETGTYWAFLLEDGRGSYIWTTDRGHALQITGSTDHVDDFWSRLPL